MPKSHPRPDTLAWPKPPAPSHPTPTCCVPGTHCSRPFSSAATAVGIIITSRTPSCIRSRSWRPFWSLRSLRISSVTWGCKCSLGWWCGRRANSRACCVRRRPRSGDVASAPCLALQTPDSPGGRSFGGIFYVSPSTAVHMDTCFAKCPPVSCVAFSSLRSQFGDGSLSLWASQLELVGKKHPARAGDVRDMAQEGPLEEGMATHSSILAWKIPMDRGACELQSVGSQSWTQVSD